MAALAKGRMRFTATGEPGETASGKLSLLVIRGELQRIINERAGTDPVLACLDGLTLYSEGDAAVHPLPDALHPDAATHQLMGERFAAMAFGDGAPLDATR